MVVAVTLLHPLMMLVARIHPTSDILLHKFTIFHVVCYIVRNHLFRNEWKWLHRSSHGHYQLQCSIHCWIPCYTFNQSSWLPNCNLDHVSKKFCHPLSVVISETKLTLLSILLLLLSLLLEFPVT